MTRVRTNLGKYPVLICSSVDNGPRGSGQVEVRSLFETREGNFAIRDGDGFKNVAVEETGLVAEWKWMKIQHTTIADLMQRLGKGPS